MVTWTVTIKCKGISFRQMLLGLLLHNESFFRRSALIIWMQPYHKLNKYSMSVFELNTPKSFTFTFSFSLFNRVLCSGIPISENRLNYYKCYIRFHKNQAWLKYTKTHHWPKYIQLVSIMMLNYCAKIEVKENFGLFNYLK